MIVLKGININVCIAYYFKVGLTWQEGPVGKIFVPVSLQPTGEYQSTANRQPTGEMLMVQ